jgi:hypothetical protein
MAKTPVKKNAKLELKSGKKANKIQTLAGFVKPNHKVG